MDIPVFFIFMNQQLIILFISSTLTVLYRIWFIDNKTMTVFGNDMRRKPEIMWFSYWKLMTSRTQPWMLQECLMILVLFKYLYITQRKKFYALPNISTNSRFVNTYIMHDAAKFPIVHHPGSSEIDYKTSNRLKWETFSIGPLFKMMITSAAHEEVYHSLFKSVLSAFSLFHTTVTA